MYSYVTSVNSVIWSDNIINNSDEFRLSAYLKVKPVQFYLFLINLGKKMSTSLVFLAIFDTCDVLYNWSISLLSPIVDT